MASKSLELNDLYKLNPLAQIGLALGVIALILALAYFVLYSGQLDELKAAEAIAESIGAERHIRLPIDLRAFGGSALTSDVAVPKDGEGQPALRVFL